MEQTHPSLGPSEYLRLDDPASLSPPPTSETIRDDLSKTLYQFEKSSIKAEDIIPMVDDIDEASAKVLALEAIHVAGTSGRIAVLAAPKIFLAIRESYPDRNKDVYMDFNPRFKTLGDDVVILPMVDQTLDAIQRLPHSIRHKFKVVVCDLSFMVRTHGTDVGWRERKNAVYSSHMKIEEILDVCRLLALLHEPLNVILVSSTEIGNGHALAEGFHLTDLQTHGRRGIKVYTSISRPQRLHF